MDRKLEPILTQLGEVKTTLDGMNTQLGEVKTTQEGMTTQLGEVNTKLDYLVSASPQASMSIRAIPLVEDRGSNQCCTERKRKCTNSS